MTKRLVFYKKALNNCWKQFEIVQARKQRVEDRLKREQELTNLEKIVSSKKPDWPWLLKISGESRSKWQERRDQLAKLSTLDEFRFSCDLNWGDGIDQIAISFGLQKNNPARTEAVHNALVTLMPFIKNHKGGYKWFVIKDNRDDYDTFYLLVKEDSIKIVKNREYFVYREGFSSLMDALKLCQQSIYFDREEGYKEEEE